MPPPPPRTPWWCLPLSLLVVGLAASPPPPQPLTDHLHSLPLPNMLAPTHAHTQTHTYTIRHPPACTTQPHREIGLRCGAPASSGLLPLAIIFFFLLLQRHTRQRFFFFSGRADKAQEMWPKLEDSTLSFLFTLLFFLSPLKPAMNTAMTIWTAQWGTFMGQVGNTAMTI